MPTGVERHHPEPICDAWQNQVPDVLRRREAVMEDQRRRIPWRFENGELKLMNRPAGIRWAQELVAKSPNAHLISSDALIAERRAEAAREDERYERWRRG